MSEKFEKLTKVRLPFDLRDSDDKKNYGIHATDVWFILKGEKGAVQFAVTLPAYLPHVQRELAGENYPYLNKISGIDVGYHSKTPVYEDQPSMDSCDLFPEGKCYYDGSSLLAQEWADEIFAVKGQPPEELLWEKLEAYYEYMFGNPTTTVGQGDS